MEDRYGEYQLLTGYEAPCKCFWCGCEVKKHRRYCCKEHSDQYRETFLWPWAAPACLKRQGHKCGDCPEEAVAVVVHHIIPLNGSPRYVNILNRPENLVGLCRACHGKRHATAKPEPIETLVKPSSFEMARERGQLIFAGMEVQHDYVFHQN